MKTTITPSSRFWVRPVVWNETGCYCRRMMMMMMTVFRNCWSAARSARRQLDQYSALPRSFQQPFPRTCCCCCCHSSPHHPVTSLRCCVYGCCCWCCFDRRHADRHSPSQLSYDTTILTQFFVCWVTYWSYEPRSKIRMRSRSCWSGILKLLYTKKKWP